MNVAKASLNIFVLWRLRRLLADFPFNADCIRQLQFNRLKKLLVYSYEKYPFYRQRMIDVSFNPYEMSSLEEMRRLPVLEKRDYRRFSESLVRSDPAKYSRYYLDGTSGSTGVPLKIYRTWNERAYMLAKYMRALFLNGYRITDTTFCLPSPHRLARRDSIVQKLGLMRRFSVAYTDSVERMIEGYLSINPEVFYANKSQLVQMAMHIQEHAIYIKRPRFYICAAETMDKNSRRLIQAVFGDDNMMEIYGAVEFNTLGFQIRGQDYLHFSHDTNILELDNNGSINGQKGYCIITDLCTYSMPLIRYRLGDWIETAWRDGLPVMVAIRGRMDDWVLFRDQTRKPFHAFYEVMERRTEISQFRIIQESYDLIRILVVIKGISDPERLRHQIIRDLSAEIKSGIEYCVEFAESIPPDPNGKLRMVISKIGQPENVYYNCSE